MSWKTISLAAICAALALAAYSAPALAQQPAAGPSRWPAQLDVADGQVTVFQPQFEDFQADQLSDRAAVSVQLNGQTDPVFGVVWLQNHVEVDQAARTVRVLDVAIAKSRFPNSDPAVDRAVSDAVGQLFASRSVTLSLDKLQSMLDTVHKEQAAGDQLHSDAPKIVFLEHPAVKVQYDGPPRLVAVDNSNLLRAANTPFFIVLNPDDKTYYLKGGGRWFAAADPLGPFNPAFSVPGDVAALAQSAGYQDPQQPVDPNQAVQIVTATDPTEVIWTSGPREMGTIPGTSLLYVANTASDVFLDIDTQQYFVLLSGRWYSSAHLTGPWSFVPPENLPADFQRIPPDSDKADVLVSVPGTGPAQDAAADAYVPQTAAVDLANYDQPPVSYDGDASFQPIDGTDMSYAVNTDSSVLLVGGRYYCCSNAVWYLSDSPAGPWDLCTAVPTEIYTIPPSCPIYPVRFVYVYGRSRDAIYYGYLPGYLGGYLYDGVVVYGTGYRYHPWIGRVYYARPDTYGFAAHYDWYTRSWGFDFALDLGGGFGWVAVIGDDHSHHDAWFGQGGFRPVYARDGAHVAVAARAFAADRAGRAAVTVNVYGRRADVHADLPGGGPGPREVSRPAAVERREPELARPEERVAPARAPDAERAPAAEERQGRTSDDQDRAQRSAPAAEEPRQRAPEAAPPEHERQPAAEAPEEKAPPERERPPAAQAPQERAPREQPPQAAPPERAPAEQAPAEARPTRQPPQGKPGQQPPQY